MSTARTLLTVGEMARLLGQPISRVEYLLRTRKVKPAGWAGNARVFEQADLDFLVSERKRIEAQRDGLDDDAY
jgi:hypothetical protein